MNILLVKPGAEQFAIDECKLHGIDAVSNTSGIVTTRSADTINQKLCFPFWCINNVTEIDYSGSVKIHDAICNWFCDQIRNTRIDSAWPLFFLTKSENGFTPDIARQERIKDILKKRISRIAKLAEWNYPHIDIPINGLFIADIREQSKIYISGNAVFGGQRRMKDDPLAPSRSFLKVEEAFALMGRSPKDGDIVADLGAAPGGWTWAALKRGATVYAIDNGPLKKGPLDHPGVIHLKTDAYTWTPTHQPVDWLFCDMVDHPFQVFERIRIWFEKKWFKNAVINFKYGYSDPVKILELLHGSSGIMRFTDSFTCKHLFHDRDEITVCVWK
jgi:23S rRNA (cytidine2498-2'-O)-methyltransferase